MYIIFIRMHLIYNYENQNIKCLFCGNPHILQNKYTVLPDSRLKQGTYSLFLFDQKGEAIANFLEWFCWCGVWISWPYLTYDDIKKSLKPESKVTSDKLTYGNIFMLILWKILENYFILFIYTVVNVYLFSTLLKIKNWKTL